MLKYDRIDILEGNDINKTNASRECDICHYCKQKNAARESQICDCWYFKDIGFKYEPYLCNGVHDLMQKAVNFNDVAFVSLKGSDYRINFWCMSKDDVITIMNNCHLNETSQLL